MRKRNGFTLVELLAVIVVLAILMIVAFPAILDVMNDAKKQNMTIFAEKMLKDAQSQYVYDREFKSDAKGSSKYEYGIESFNYTNIGDYDGCVIVNANAKQPTYQVIVADNTYKINVNVSSSTKWDNTLASDLGDNEKRKDAVSACKYAKETKTDSKVTGVR